MRDETGEQDAIIGQACPATSACLYTLNLATALGASSAFGFALAVFYLLPKYLATDLGADAGDIGVVTAVFGLATVAAAPLAGVFVDRRPRKQLIGLGSLVMAAASLGFLLVDGIGPGMLVLRAVQGACFAAVLTAIGALVADLAPPERLSEALGLAGASMLVMSAVAPPLVEPLAAAAGWPAVFVVAGLAAALGAMLSTLVVEDLPVRDHGVRGADGLRSFLRRRLIRHYALVTAAIGAAFGVMFTFQQPFVLALGREEVGGFFVAYALVAIGVRIGFGSLADRFGRLRMAVFALNLYTVTVLGMASLRPELLELVGALLGLAHGLFFPAFNALAISKVGPTERGKVLSVFTGSFYGGLASGVLVFGFVAEVAGYGVVFAATAAITCLAGILLLFSSELGEAGQWRS